MTLYRRFTNGKVEWRVLKRMKVSNPVTVYELQMYEKINFQGFDEIQVVSENDDLFIEGTRPATKEEAEIT